MIADTFNETKFLTQPEMNLTPCDYNITFDVYGYPEPKVPSIEDFKVTCDKNPWYPLGEFDSTKWAPEFKKIGVELGFLPADIDDSPGGWLHAWFCSAIMTGYDYANQRNESLQEFDEWEEDLIAEDTKFSFWGA